jgi:pSer/pThr/pTyr-binding forkhead associated (FHA) protein
MLNNSKVKEGIYLENSKGIILPVFCKSEVILGREDEGVQVDIAIDSKYISRPHLKMELKDGKLYLEDLHSSGGSYKAGEKIDQTEITNNQTVTLAKVIDLNICLQKVDNLMAGGDTLRAEVDRFMEQVRAM